MNVDDGGPYGTSTQRSLNAVIATRDHHRACANDDALSRPVRESYRGSHRVGSPSRRATASGDVSRRFRSGRRVGQEQVTINFVHGARPRIRRPRLDESSNNSDVGLHRAHNSLSFRAWRTVIGRRANATLSKRPDGSCRTVYSGSSLNCPRCHMTGAAHPRSSLRAIPRCDACGVIPIADASPSSAVARSRETRMTTGRSDTGATTRPTDSGGITALDSSTSTVAGRYPVRRMYSRYAPMGRSANS